MINMKFFLELMGATTYSVDVSEQDRPAFLHNQIINEASIRMNPVDDSLLQQMTDDEREQFVMDMHNSLLNFPCTLAEFRTWVFNNGHENLVDWTNLKDENEALKKVAKIKGERLRMRMNSTSIDDIILKNIHPAQGNIDVLAEQYCWQSILHQAIKKVDDDTKSSLSDKEEMKAKLRQKIQEIDEAIEANIDFSSDEAIEANLDFSSYVSTNQKPKNKHRENELHELIYEADQHLQKYSKVRPTYKYVWREIEQNHSTYDKLEIIEEITSQEIIWVSTHGHRSKLKYTSFCKTLSNIRRKYRQ